MFKTFVMAVAVIFVMTASSFAHPPQAVEIEFDKEAGALTATVSHAVSDPASHYIFKIVMKVNGETIEEQELEGQDDEAGLIYETIIEGLNAGDTVEFIAFCNKGGELGASYIVP